MNKRKTLKHIIILLVTILTFFFVVPIAAAMELPTNTTFHFQENGKEMNEYKIKQEDLDAIKEFQGKIILNSYETTKASLTFANSTKWKDIQFQLFNIISDIKDEQLLKNLQVYIHVDNSIIYAGPFSEIPEPITAYLPPENITVDFEFFLSEETNQEYSNLEINLTLLTDIRTNIVGCIEPEPVFPELQEYIINKNTINKEFTLNSSVVFPNSDMDLGFKIKNELNQDIELTIKNISFINPETNNIENISPADINFYFNPEYFNTWAQIPANTDLIDYIGLNYPDYVGEIPFTITFETRTLEKTGTNNDTDSNYNHLILLGSALPLSYLFINKLEK